MKLKKILPIIGLAILFYLIYSIGLEKITSAITGIKIGFLLISIFLFIPMTLLQTWKWGVLLKKQGFDIEYWYTFKVQWISTFYGAITPGKVGSLIKAVYLKDKTGRSFGECISNAVLDKFLDLFTISLLAGIGSLFLIGKSSNLSIAIIGLFFVLLIGLFIISNKKRTGFFFKLFYDYLVPNKIKEKIKDGVNGFYSNLPGFKSLIYPFIISILIWVLIYTQAYFVALALSVKVPFFIFITIFPIGTIIGLIPITIGGFGTRELILVSLFELFGVAPEKMMAVSLIWVVLSFIYAMVGGVFSMGEGNKAKVTENL